MIDSVNAVTPSAQQGPEGASEDPMSQIVQILSSHLESLQWIDGAVRDIEGKVGDVEKRVRDAGGALGGMGGSQVKTRGFGVR
jgi:nuclear pore complex protein Nup62